MEPLSNADKLQSVSITCPKCKNANVINIRGGKFPDVVWFHCSFCSSNSPKSKWLVGLDQLQSIQQERDKLIEGLRYYTDDTQYCGRCDGVTHDTGNGDEARRILRDIGVGEERT